VCVDPRQLDRSFAGRRFDAELLAALPAGVDPCGENGEFHTFVYAGPVFGRPIRCHAGAVTVRDGFAFCDVRPARRSAGATPRPPAAPPPCAPGQPAGPADPVSASGARYLE
jgi:hypothetical protein